MGSCVMACSQKGKIVSPREKKYVEPLERKSIQQELEENIGALKIEVSTVNHDVYALEGEDRVNESQELSRQVVEQCPSQMRKSRFCPGGGAFAASSVSIKRPAGEFLQFSVQGQINRQFSDGVQKKKALSPHKTSDDFGESSSRQYSEQNSVSGEVNSQGAKRRVKEGRAEKDEKREKRGSKDVHRSLEGRGGLKENSSRTMKRTNNSTGKVALSSSTRTSNKDSLTVQGSEIAQRSLGNVTSNLHNPSYLHSHLISFSQQPKDSMNEGIMKSTQHFSVPTANNLGVVFDDESIYRGEWLAGVRHGEGILSWKDGSYEGEWKMNKMWGHGVVKFTNGQRYEGQWEENQAHGSGIFVFADGSFYQGEWQHNKQSGKGIQKWSENERYEGQWSHGEKHGFGELTFSDGSYYKGNFDHNQFHGRGYYYWKGKFTYDGEWQHNKKCGRGVMKLNEGVVYEGEFQNDKIHGKGKWTDKNDYVFEGTWQCGRKHGHIVETTVNGEVRAGLWYCGKFVCYQGDEPSELYKVQKKLLREGEYFLQAKGDSV